MNRWMGPYFLFRSRYSSTWHFVKKSPWPFFASLGGFNLLFCFTLYMHKYISFYIVFGELLFLSSVVFSWFFDIIFEGTILQKHTTYVDRSMTYGFVLFVVSEIMFFFSIFFAFFHSALVPTIFIGCIWPPIGVENIISSGVAMSNTITLIFSGVILTWAQYSIRFGDFIQAIAGMILTIVFGGIFTYWQYTEYCSSFFCIDDSVYGTCFYFLTGTHGSHVIIGLCMLAFVAVRLYFMHFSATSHIIFTLAAWYWHFVDVVWVFVYSLFYIWGGRW